MKGKSAIASTEAMRAILAEANGPLKDTPFSIPTQMQSDQGKEFVNAPFKELMRKNKILFTQRANNVKCPQCDQI